MNDKEALITLSSFASFGPVRLKLLLEYFGNAAKVWTASHQELETTGLSPQLIKNFLRYKQKFSKMNYFDRLKRGNVRVVTIYDADYPSRLLSLQDKPILLYIKGSVDILEKPTIAVIGTREMSFYGRKTTEEFTQRLVDSGFVIIAGLARGVDTKAHESALKSEGFTAAILGSGIDRVYPPENTNLASNIVNSKSVLLSEYPLGYPPLPSNFVLRNRLVSGLSDAVLVVEGKRKSGTLITASHAANQGKQVFTIQGQIDSPLSEASHFLIQNGAKLVNSPEDVLEEIKETSFADTSQIKSEIEEKLLQIITKKPLHIDDIAKMSSLESLDVSARLTSMEIKGLVKRMKKGYYQKVES